MKVEDESTHYVDIGPVNKVLNMLAVWYHKDKNNEDSEFRQHRERFNDYLWLAKDGMKMQGYNGSQLWDASFALIAMCESGMTEEFKDTLILGHQYIDITQVREDVPDASRWHRHPHSKGAWPFSTRDHGWPIADCTSFGLIAALLLKDLRYITPMEDVRYHDAVNVILSLQNSDGGWPTYELQRGPSWVEWLNPSEVFYGIMVDYSYCELTSSCLQSLSLFTKHFPQHRSAEIKASISSGVRYLKKIQQDDGSWIGSWGVCFTYGAWFGIEGLVAVGEPLSSPFIKKACNFLLSKQRADGGWGEDFQACVTRKWEENEESQVVNTAWSVLALLKAGWNKEPIQRAVQFLRSKQKPNGDWDQQSISGVFNANCSISYSQYKNIFPCWALARYANIYHE